MALYFARSSIGKPLRSRSAKPEGVCAQTLALGRIEQSSSNPRKGFGSALYVFIELKIRHRDRAGIQNLAGKQYTGTDGNESQFVRSGLGAVIIGPSNEPRYSPTHLNRKRIGGKNTTTHFRAADCNRLQRRSVQSLRRVHPNNPATR